MNTENVQRLINNLLFSIEILSTLQSIFEKPFQRFHNIWVKFGVENISIAIFHIHGELL